MNKKLFIGCLLIFLAGCTPVYTAEPTASKNVQAAAPLIALTTVTGTPIVTPSATPDRFADVRVSQTVVALESTRLSQQAEQIQAEQAALNMQLTVDAATLTVAAAIQQTATAQANVYATQTAQAPVQATAQANTQVVATRTAQFENQQYRSDVAGLWIGRVLGGLVGLVIVLGFGALVVVGIRGLYFKLSQMEPDDNGRYKAVARDAIPGKRKAIVNLNLAHRAVVGEEDDLTAEQALLNTQSLRNLEATRAIVQSPALLRRIQRRLPAADEANLPQGNVMISKQGYPLLGDGTSPAWSMMEGWDGTGGIPYGVSVQGLERLNLSQVPHGGIFGQTGKGKSRYFLRPFIAGAIASGQRVVILGKQADFWPFAEHPNVKMIPIRHITKQEEAERYTRYLKRMVEEMNRRDDYLTTQHRSLWDRENTLLVLDELGNTLDMLPRDIAKEAYRWVAGLTKEGRKVGFNVWLASQRAVGFKSIVEQLGRAVFYLADSEASRAALGCPGAETLREGEFFAKFHGLKRCASFDATDDELAQFLRERTVKTHEPIDWIEGEEVGEQPVKDESARDLRILDMHLDGNSQAEIERIVFGYKGGRAATIVSEVIKRYKITTTAENMPDLSLGSGVAAQ